jgi:hypothetical protein
MVDEFKKGDWVMVDCADHYCNGAIGVVTSAVVGKFGILVMFKGFGSRWFRSVDLKHATKQEIAHHYAKEICDG